MFMATSFVIAKNNQVSLKRKTVKQIVIYSHYGLLFSNNNFCVTTDTCKNMYEWVSEFIYMRIWDSWVNLKKKNVA